MIRIARSVAAGYFLALPAISQAGPDSTGIDSVVQAIRESSADTARLSVCVMLSKANQPAAPGAKEAHKKAVELVSQKLKAKDPTMLRARADAARSGLYGFPKDATLALKIYERIKNAEAGMNAALMLFSAATAPMDPVTAKRILDVLQKSGASKPNSRGLVGAQSHYIAGVILESGVTGVADTKTAFTHFRASARNSYVPGAYHYLRLLSQSMSKLPEVERSVVTQELRMMMSRWRWQSTDIMLLTGDMYAAKWIPDQDGFIAQYHWRMAKRMGTPREIPDFATALSQRIKKMAPDKEKRLDEAVESGLRNVMNVKHDLEFADLCVE